MKNLVISVAAIIVAFVVISSTVYAGQYYVIRDRAGEMAVTNGTPHYGWLVESGPYATCDAAERATGQGMGCDWHYNSERYFTYPQVSAKGRYQGPFKEMP